MRPSQNPVQVVEIPEKRVPGSDPGPCKREASSPPVPRPPPVVRSIERKKPR